MRVTSKAPRARIASTAYRNEPHPRLGLAGEGLDLEPSAAASGSQRAAISTAVRGSWTSALGVSGGEGAAGAATHCTRISEGKSELADDTKLALVEEQRKAARRRRSAG